MEEPRINQRFRSFVESMPLPICAVCPEGTIGYANPAWCEYTGRAGESGTSVWDLGIVHPDEVVAMRAAWQRARTDARSFDLEARLRRNTDAAYLWHRIRAAPSWDASGAVERFVVTLINIDMQKRAEAANIAKDEFLATLSHEIRTPLNAMLGWAHILRTKNLDETTRARALDVIERNGHAQARLIEDLLDVSRIVTGKIRLDVRPLDLCSVIEAAVDAVQPAAAQKRIRIALACEPSVGVHSGDQTRLQQIVSNLLTNAVKFGIEGGNIEVALSRRPSYVEIRVTDDGQGIRSDFLPRVFARFQQADERTTRSHGGLGLGLAIVRHLVELHGGTITAESDGQGKGATFRVRLPARRSSETSLRAVGCPVPFADPPDLRGARILVVDNESDARELVVTILGHCGATVHAVPSVKEALETMGSAMPDVLVSDIGMPGEDGYSFIRKVRSFAPDLPAIAVTAYAGAEDRTRALRAGFQSHLPKPIEPAQLAFAVANLFSGPLEP